MRFILLVMLILSLISTRGVGQQWQGIVSLDSRFGYSTNSYLNPFLSDWDTGAESGYNFTSALMQTYWYKDKNTVSLTGGILFEPIFSQTETWKGGLGVASYNYRFSNSWSAGLEAGVSYFTSAYSRSIGWIQPKVTWFASPFTLFRLKTGSNFRSYQNYPDGQSNASRFDFYGIEFETWPDYKWQITAGLYGSLDTLPSIQEGFNTKTSVGYYFKNGAKLGINFGFDQYQIETTEQNQGGPPINGPGNQPSVTVTNTDRMLRFGLEGSLPIDERFTVFTAVELLQYQSEASNSNIGDFQISGGLRFSFEPKIGSSHKMVMPEWDVDRSKQQVSIQYSAEGRLYLVGDFNNWRKTGIPLRKQEDNTFVAQLELSPGAYEYKILRKQGDTEEWLRFSNETYTVSDGFGSKNAMLLVE